MKQNDTGAPISREWGAYMIKPSFSEEEAIKAGEPWPEKSSVEIEEYKNSILSGYESHIHVLPTPIVVDLGVKAIITIKSNNKIVRIYPPFPIDERGETSGALAGAEIPSGLHSVTGYRPLPSDAVRGARVSPGTGPNAQWSRGLRLDVETGANERRVLRLLIDHICQYTHQWWLRATHNPFLGFGRMGGMVTKDFDIPQTFRYRSAGTLESTWYGMVESQSNLGIGRPLSEQTWLLLSTHVSAERDADTGILSFHDAFASYMAGDDKKCILNLAIAVEIMLFKHMNFTENRTSNESIDKLLRKTRMIDDPIKNMLKKLFIDRGHVAHGREPYLLNRDKECSLESYIATVRRVISAYLASIPAGKWPDIMTMTI